MSSPKESPDASVRRVLVCVGGGIAAYKVCELVRLLVKAGVEVRCAMTSAAQRFVGPLTLQALSGNPVSCDLFDAGQELTAGHIALADWAQLAVVAPATADLLARLRAGLADDAVCATLLAIPTGRWLVAPAMNERMWASPATVENLAALRGRGVQVVGPAVGEMAERSHVGPGRLVEAAELAQSVLARLTRGTDLGGARLLITAGATREPLDPVRYLSNPSTGKMGFALAEAARDRGAQVTLIAGPTELPLPGGVEVQRIVTAAELAQAVESRAAQATAIIMAAAVSDQRPAEVAPHKVKKKDGEELLRLVRTADILAGLGARFHGQAGRPLLVGFSAETERLEEHARDKLLRKKLDLIVANDVSAQGAGFASDRNAVVILDAGALRREVSGSKLEVAHAILDALRERLG